MLVIQANTPEDVRLEMIHLIQSTAEHYRNIGITAKRKTVIGQINHTIAALEYLFIAVKTAKIEPF